MPKIPTYPTLIDEVKTIEIRSLKRWGYLIPNNHHMGTINWRRHGGITSQVSIAITTQASGGAVWLSYNWKEKPIEYIVKLICKPSNLGKGVVWYFRCPRTEKLCRKLYWFNGRFLHREAAKGAMYDRQIYSKTWRYQFQQMVRESKRDKLIGKTSQKYYKPTYAGKPTKFHERYFGED